MDKYDLEAEEFKRNFREYREKRIVLYGIGRRTLTLLPRIKEYNIVGLLDRDSGNIGKEIHGIRIIPLGEVEEKADILIINSDTTNYLTIYRRIYGLRLPVYYSNGKKAIKSDLDSERINSDELWMIDCDEIYKGIDKHTIITFDVFDTLLARKVLDPADVFDMMQDEYTKITGRLDSFREIRQNAINDCKPYCSIEEIYNEIGRRLNLDVNEQKELLNAELIAEKLIIYPRKEMLSLFEYALRSAKQVYLISDMYLGSECISEFLYQFTDERIPRENIIVSCEVKAEKSDGRLWELFLGRIDSNYPILHIGDDSFADELIPKNMGVDCIRINSGKRMLELSCFNEMGSKAVELSDRISTGLFIHKIYNSPFLPYNNGRILFHSEDLGYCIFGPLIYKFLLWMLESTDFIPGRKIIFLARDGYFLKKDFDFLSELLKQKGIESPDSMYLPISRRLVLISALPDEEAWNELLRIPFDGIYADFMKSRFNVQVDKRTESINEEKVTIKKETIEPYEKEIREELEREKNKYLDYLKDKEIIGNDRRNVLVDLGCQGTNQYYLQKVTKNKYEGRYLYANLCDDNRFLKECNIKACFQHESDPIGRKSAIRQKSAYLESFLTAPYGMIRFIDNDGEIVCEKNRLNQDYFEIKEKINRGVLSYISDQMDLYINADHEISIDYVNEIYDRIWSSCCVLDKEAAASFVFDNDMIGSAEQKLIGC